MIFDIVLLQPIPVGLAPDGFLTVAIEDVVFERALLITALCGELGGDGDFAAEVVFLIEMAFRYKAFVPSDVGDFAGRCVNGGDGRVARRIGRFALVVGGNGERRLFERAGVFCVDACSEVAKIEAVTVVGGQGRQREAQQF